MTPPPRMTSAGSDFPPVSYEAWRQKVAEELSGQVPESALGRDLPGGISVRPLYTADNSKASERVLPAGETRPSDGVIRPWRIAVEVHHRDPQQAVLQIDRDLAHGADLLWLGAECQEHTGELLGAVDLENVAVVLDSGAEAGAASSRWNALIETRDLDPQRVEGSLGVDPLGTLASRGALPMSLDAAWSALAEAATRCVTETPGMRAALISAAPYHEAGATPTDELACALTAGLETLRQLTAAGLDIDRAAGQLLFAFGVGSDVFLEIAKLRAARLLWAKVVAASGGAEEARRMRIHARTSETSWTARAPWLNLLRGGYGGLAAAVSGVWSLGIQPFDTALGVPIERSRRLAISTQHLLAEEAHFGRVADPAAGSWYVEDLTSQLARAVWERCRKIESLGGFSQALLQGKIQTWVGEGATERDRAVAHRREVIVGVSEFVHLEEKTPVREPVPESETGTAAAGMPATGTPAAVELPVALPHSHRALGFEILREAAENWQDQHGRRPRLGLLGLGSPEEFGPRANFARAFFAPGAVEAITLESTEAFESTEFDGAVLCGTDQRYTAEASALVRRLRERGARWVFLTGRPRPEDEEEFREAGVDACIFRGADVLEVLEAFLGDLGVFS